MIHYTYTLGLIPSTVVPELIPGHSHHISVYKPAVGTDDPVLELLKRPSKDKWYWHSAQNAL